MATIINGNIMGIKLYGEINSADVQNLAQITEAIERLHKALETMFNSEVADMAMSHIMETTKVEVKNGDVENLAEWQRLYASGMVFCKARGKELS